MRPKPGAGFVALRRSEETRELLKIPNAFSLLAVIALRARWSEMKNLHGLTMGQALIGDHAAYGLTRQQERTAKEQLAKLGLASFVGTPQGTIATLTGGKVFESGRPPSAPKSNRQDNQLFPEENPEIPTNEATSSQPAANQQPTTNEQGNKETKKQGIQGTDVPAVFPDGLNSEAFKAAWAEWHAYRRERKLRLWIASTHKAKLAELAAMGEAEAIAAIRGSIANGWQSIYPARGNPTNPSKPAKPFFK